MPIIKSNSALVAFDSSAYNDLDTFVFLNYIQSFSLNISSKRINHKSLGSDSLIRRQFVKPAVELNLSYFQEKGLSNETIFGFYKIITGGYQASFARSLINFSSNKGFSNRSAVVIFSDTPEDLILKINSGGFDSNFITLSVGNLFINSYSISYKINQIPIVSCSFLCSDFKLANLLRTDNIFTRFYVKNWDDRNIQITSSSVSDLKTANDYASQFLNYLMRDFKFENNFSSTSTPGPKIDNFLDGLIQSVDMSIDFNRSEFYFFNSGDDVSDRQINVPIKIDLNISGISNNFEIGDLNLFFNQDQRFSCSILMGIESDISSNCSKLIFENLCVESFDYSIDVNGMLNYTIKCYCEVNQTSGFKILEINKADPTDGIFISSDGYTFLTSDLYDFRVKI
jgi:hypothetical protein